MAEAVENSLQYMTPADLHAMVAYLRDLPARSDGPLALRSAAAAAGITAVSASMGGGKPYNVAPNADSPDSMGARVFAQACAGCHLPDGAGRQSSWAALGGDHTTGDPSGANMIQVLLHGSQIDTKQGLMFMHGFAGAYTNEELAAVSNYTIAQFSGRTGTVAAKDFVPPSTPPLGKIMIAAFAAFVLCVGAAAGFVLLRRTRGRQSPTHGAASRSQA